MRVLVTGGAGFIGSHLCERLLSDGHFVICVDNYYSGDKSNVQHLLTNPHFELIRHDVTLPLVLEIDQIYHLACPASPGFYQSDPIGTLKTNVLGTLNMLELARAKAARFLLTSTSEVYGDPLEHPQKETYWGNVNPIGIRSCYDEGKRAAETAAFDFHRQYGVDVRVARIFNTYGPRMLENDGRVVSNFIVQALRNEKLTVYGSGQQTRSFCFVDDMVAGLVALMNGDFIGPCNLGMPHETTVSELAELVLRKIPESKSAIVQCDLPSDDPRKRLPNIDNARKHLNWEPKVKLEEGLDRTIAYFREYVARGVVPLQQPRRSLHSTSVAP